MCRPARPASDRVGSGRVGSIELVSCGSIGIRAMSHHSRAGSPPTQNTGGAGNASVPKPVVRSSPPEERSASSDRLPPQPCAGARSQRRLLLPTGRKENSRRTPPHTLIRRPLFCPPYAMSALDLLAGERTRCGAARRPPHHARPSLFGELSRPARKLMKRAPPLRRRQLFAPYSRRIRHSAGACKQRSHGPST